MMITIKKIEKNFDFEQIPHIQKSAWGFKDIDIEPPFLMMQMHKFGGLIQGLFINDTMVGFTFGVIGRRLDSTFIYSHMTAVAEEYQGRGFGLLLKQAQRREVLKMGYDIILWTFDPIESVNAYFNIHRLGVICSEYRRNVYGTGKNGLHKGLPTDRLVAVWNLRSERTVKKMKEKENRIMEDIPPELLGNFTRDTAYVEIPPDIRKVKHQDMTLALHWRMKTREYFESAFQEKFSINAMVFSKDGKRIFYKLVRQLKK